MRLRTFGSRYLGCVDLNLVQFDIGDIVPIHAGLELVTSVVFENEIVFVTLIVIMVLVQSGLKAVTGLGVEHP